MNVDISKLPTYLINLPEDKERLASAKSCLSNLSQDYTITEAIKHSTSVIGCAMSHLNIFKKYSPSCLILEDDIALTDNLVQNIEVPDNADAVYLGLSDHGHVPNWHLGVKYKAEFENINKDLVKVKNMCSTHAIIYLTSRYWEVVKTATEYSIKNGLAFDLTFASLHRYFNIYGLKRPMFYQSGQSLNTSFKLN